MEASRAQRILLFLAILYGLASLIHFIHNAVYLHDYPNMPTSFTALGVYLAWLVIAAFGCAGYLLYRGGWPRSGLLVLGIYTLFGFDSLGHYVLAPLSAHTVAMNATILSEIGAAAALLLFVLYLLPERLRGGSHGLDS
jgi:hypothetical protein